MMRNSVVGVTLHMHHNMFVLTTCRFNDIHEVRPPPGPNFKQVTQLQENVRLPNALVDFVLSQKRPLQLSHACDTKGCGTYHHLEVYYTSLENDRRS